MEPSQALSTETGLELLSATPTVSSGSNWDESNLSQFGQLRSVAPSSEQPTFVFGSRWW